MGKLRVPSNGLIKRILAEVDFDGRMEGYRLRERSGPLPVLMYRFEEVVSFLNDSHPRLDFKKLEEWVRGIMGDPELAEKIAGATKKGNSDLERTRLIRDWMEERLNQCKTEECDEEDMA